MSKPPTIITVIIAEGEETKRTDLHSLLEQIPGIQVLTRAQGNGGGIQLIVNLGTPVAPPGLATPDVSAVDFERRLHGNYPVTMTLMLTGDERGDYLANVVETGAENYLEQNLTIDQFLSALRRAARGEAFSIGERIGSDEQEKASAEGACLSPREREVLQRLAQGDENKSIASALGITVNTVEKHLSNIYKKLGVTSRVEAAQWWDKKITDFRN